MDQSIMFSLVASGVLPTGGGVPISGIIPISAVLQVGTSEVTDAAQLMEWSLAIFLALLELTIITLIWIGTSRPTNTSKWTGINLQKLVGEENGDASFSRFQFLIFTFIIASAYIVLAFHNVSMGASLPEISQSVLGLIGISSASYVVSKGIETAGKSASGSTSSETATDTQKTVKSTTNQDGSVG